MVVVPTIAVSAQEASHVGPFPGRASLFADQRRGCLVAVHAGNTFLETWELHGAGWLFRNRIARSQESLAIYHDARTAVTVALPLQPVGTSRVWDGFEWRSQPRFSGGPMARSAAAFAWDAVRGDLLVFGGHSMSGSTMVMHQDTWAWNGTAWRSLGGTAPPARSYAAMAFDEARGEMVMFGGFDGFGSAQVYRGDTWVHDGVQWSPRPGAGPAARAMHSLAFDASSQRMVLHGGLSPGGTFADTWTWDGTAWAQAAWQVPGASVGETLWSVPGGLAQVTRDAEASHLWQWDGSSWTERVRAALPFERSDPAVASDPVRGNVVLFGGGGGSTPWADTWTWDGQWRVVRPPVAPPARTRAGLQWHAARGELLLFGGFDGTQVLADTWTFDGRAWTPRPSAQRPSARMDVRLAAHAARGEVVLVGGFDGGTSLGGTWLWNGAAWRQHLGGEPVARHEHVLVGDDARGRVVLAGGLTIAPGLLATHSDTWEWDGIGWALHPATWVTLGSPAWYQPGLGVVVLQGAMRRVFDGVAWRWLDSTAVPGVPSAVAAVTWHERRGRAWLLGDANTTGPFVLGPTPAVITGGGDACASPMPRLTTAGRSRIGEFEFRLEVDAVVPAAPTFVMLGLDDQGPMVDGCRIAVSDLVMNVPAVADPIGRVVVPLPIPDLLGIRGLSLFGQAAVMAPSGPSLGLALSDGLAIRVGD